MIERDEILVLPSGTELSVEAALGDLNRTIEVMSTDCNNDWSAEMSDLEHVGELLQALAEGVST